MVQWAGKHIKHGVKRQHNIIEGALLHLEQIAKIDGVKKVIPAVISYKRSRKIDKLRIKIQRELPNNSGFKLLIHNKGAIQEIFVVVIGSKKNEVNDKLKQYIETI